MRYVILSYDLEINKEVAKADYSTIKFRFLSSLINNGFANEIDFYVGSTIGFYTISSDIMIFKALDKIKINGVKLYFVLIEAKDFKKVLYKKDEESEANFKKVLAEYHT